VKIITHADVEYLANELAAKHVSLGEPIPNFSTRHPNILESCILAPFQTFSGSSLYPSLVKKASILFCLMIKNHPFQNGNKRIAIATLLMFLHNNGKWLRVDESELYQFTVWVAQSLPQVKDQVVNAIEQFIKRSLVKVMQ
jgi:death-on-curing family protein